MNKLKEGIKEVVSRFKEESPSFFKKLKKASLYLAGAGVAMLTANKTLELGIDDTTIKVVSYIIFLLVGIAGTSQLTKK